MSRYWLLRSLIFAAAIAAYSLGETLAVADDKPTQANGSSAKDDSEESPSKRIDRAILTYENRAETELDHTRKEIERLRKELGEMLELQIEMAISLAELQAELKAAVAASSADGGSPPTSSESASASRDQEQEQRRLRALELTRELRGVLDNLRGLVAQKRNETDQLVIQLRNLRAQQRQMAADRERNKQQGVAPSKD